MPITPIAKAAIAEARRRSEEGPHRDSGICLILVRECYGIPPGGNANMDGDADAFDAWFRSEHKHPETNPARVPRGVPIFWQGGSANHGHVAIATGFSGNCWSTDIKRKGYFDRCKITQIHEDWNLKLLGWTEDLNGVRVHQP